jgi:tRNA pseudouridine65 synthase
MQDARKDSICLGRNEMSWANGCYGTIRYSFVEERPHTGLYHQIRRHLNRLALPVVDETVHEDESHNCLRLERTRISRLMLDASRLWVRHLFAGDWEIQAPLPGEFHAALRLSGWTFFLALENL